MRKDLFASIAGLALLVAGCAFDPARGPGPVVQGWAQKARVEWYSVSQGSRLVPHAWALALVDSETGQPFFGDLNMARFGYLPSTSEPGLSLPVGFSVDHGDDTDLTVTKLRWYDGQGSKEPWVGMNCAACHTGVISHGAEQLRIDGAPTMADFQAFTGAFDASLAATLHDSARFDAFAAKVLGNRYNALNSAQLRQALGALTGWEAQVAAANAVTMRYGPARLDAVGHIYHKMALLAGGDGTTGFPANAPVSYPFIWNTHQSDRLQWNGMALAQDIHGFDVGALGRNAGEVIGVFGDVAIVPNPDHKTWTALKGYPSSVSVGNLTWLELVLAKLQPPAWPERLLGSLDHDKVAAGQALYRANCASCHGWIAPLDLKTHFTTTMIPFVLPNQPGTGTDPAMACNAYLAHAATGKLAGTTDGYVGSKAGFGANAPLADMLPTTVIGVLANQKATLIGDGLTIMLGGEPPLMLGALAVGAPAAAPCIGKQNKILAYKARPLNGIWATGPFLHNGSVPTLYDLLRPAALRPKKFYVGSHEYDPVKVGFVTEKSPENVFAFDTSVAGNSNAGHEYLSDKATGKPFTEFQRLSLVEYMKTL